MTALLVPMTLDVLVLRAAAGAAPTALLVPATLPANPTWKQLAPPPFGGDIARAPGAYVMASLPDGLTAAVPDASGTPNFPAIPQRWLILRLSGDATAAPRSVAAWLISDVDAAGAPTVVANALTTPWPALAGPSPHPLTVLGPGDLAWSGYFDNVAGVLGFHDDLTGAQGPISYLACAWYAYPVNDPLSGVTSETALEAVLTGLGWSPPADATSMPPTSILCHGAAVAFGWPDATWPGDGGTLSAEAGGPPDPAQIDVALADTIVEAATALGADVDGDPTDQLLVSAAMGGMLSQLAQPDGPATLDTALHAARFQALPSSDTTESIWQTAITSSDDDGSSNGTATPQDEGEFIAVGRSTPRVFAPVDPVVVLTGAGRSYSHGGDGRFSPDATLACRASGQTVTWAGAAGSTPADPAAVVDPAVQTQLANQGAPAEVWDLLIETAMLDPSGPPDLALATANQASPDTAARAAWLSDPTTPPATLAGTVPSPVAIHGPIHPWNPMHVEWQLDWVAATDGIHAFALGAVDFDTPDSSSLPATDPAVRLSGRSLLSAAPAAIGAGGAAAALAHLDAAGLLEDHPVADHLAELVQPLADAGGRAAITGAEGALADQDILSGSLQDFLAQLSGASTGVVVSSAGGTADHGTRPDVPNPIRAGLVTLVRARLVDGFGQYLYLAGSSATAPADLGQVRIGAAEVVDGQPGVMVMVPRFNAPARVMLRYTNAGGDRQDASTSISPVCGFIVPSPIDGSIEFFGADGAALGRLRPDPVRGTVWEEDPGQPASLGAKPSAGIPNPFLGAFADGLLAFDSAQAATGTPPAQTALAALALLTDETRFTVDPGGSAGDEHLALLLGRPIAVLRAGVKIDVQYSAPNSTAPTTAVPVKLGTLAHTSDGLLAYFVADDYGHVHAVDPSIGDVSSGATTQITSSYVDPSPWFGVQPGVGVDLTLLAEPASEMHCTVGLLPQKDIGMRRDWVAPGLANLTPNWRYGPVLVDPRAARIPIPGDVHGQWFWHRHSDPTTWATDTVVNATADALLGDNPVIAQEGWMSVQVAPDPNFPGIPFQVTHMTKPIPGPKYRIQGIGAYDDTTKKSIWWLSTDDAIGMVQSGRFSFYVLDTTDPNTPIQVGIVVDVSPSGRPFLRTAADDRTTDNLAGLPQMPAQY
jgi:Protein of unknown function (DUF3892)